MDIENKVKEMTLEQLKEYVERKEVENKAVEISHNENFEERMNAFKSRNKRFVNGRHMGTTECLAHRGGFRIYKFNPSGRIICNKHACRFNEKGECIQTFTRIMYAKCTMYRFDKGKFCQNYPGIVQARGIIVAGIIIGLSIVATNLLPYWL